MKFYNRSVELALLRKNHLQSYNTACFQAIVGRRRIGKTMLITESLKGEKYLYFFISRKNENLLCAEFQNDIERMIGLKIFGTIKRFKDLFEQLLIFATTEHLTLVIDEFQEFDNVNPAIFSDIQNLWDQYNRRSKINFIVCGSIYSLMMKIFENNKEPLFGRLTSKLHLQPFKVDVIKEILHDYNPHYKPEDLLCLYVITGGVAKYIEILMDANAFTKDLMLNKITQMDSVFLNEGRDLLVTEFGKEYGTYFSILQLIASGKTAQSEIDSIIEKNTGAYLNNLEKDYSLIVRNKPIFSKPNSRKTRWNLKDNYLQFWFRFIYSNQSLIESGRFDLLREIIELGYTQFSGLLLEKYFREKIFLEERITEIGAYWDNKGENEIDVVALNNIDKTVIIAEVKCNPKKIDLEKLAIKVRTIQKDVNPYQLELRGLSMEDM